jgi:hypothetical protein
MRILGVVQSRTEKNKPWMCPIFFPLKLEEVPFSRMDSRVGTVVSFGGRVDARTSFTDGGGEGFPFIGALQGIVKKVIRVG